jgi:hypothetical protein
VFQILLTLKHKNREINAIGVLCFEIGCGSALADFLF